MSQEFVLSYERYKYTACLTQQNRETVIRSSAHKGTYETETEKNICQAAEHM